MNEIGTKPKVGPGCLKEQLVVKAILGSRCEGAFFSSLDEMVMITKLTFIHLLQLS
jgi:hypothetical protein